MTCCGTKVQSYCLYLFISQKISVFVESLTKRFLQLCMEDVHAMGGGLDEIKAL